MSDTPKLTMKALDEKLDAVVENTNEVITDLAAEVEVKFNRILDAINNPVVLTKDVDANDLVQENLGEASFDESAGEATLIETCLQDVDSPEFKAKAEMEAFLAEKVKVHIHDTAEEQADPYFNIWVNGKAWTFFRNEQYTVPRYVVFGLAKARPTKFDNKKSFTHEGIETYTYPARSGLRYGFSVIEDRNPLGREWLTKAMAA